jgi:ABC-type siderophore export system fused ATPase/permease subunit
MEYYWRKNGSITLNFENHSDKYYLSPLLLVSFTILYTLRKVGSDFDVSILCKDVPKIPFCIWMRSALISHLSKHLIVSSINWLRYICKTMINVSIVIWNVTYIYVEFFFPRKLTLHQCQRY